MGAAAGLAFLVPAGAALAQSDAEQRLAEKYAPVVRLVEQTRECGPGEPFVPVNVDRVLGNEEVVLRGGWDTTNVLKVAPVASDLRPAPATYHLDFPGDPIHPGCDYEQFSRRTVGHSRPTTYARVTTEPGKPGKLSLQYWFYYLFNDFNNKHEGDWEMIQLVFDADTAAQALTRAPTIVGYSQHEGAEQATWGAAKLEIVDGTHPVVYPAEGSHANHYEAALYLGRSAAEGVGCDNTTAPHHELRPVVSSVPSNIAASVAEYPWLGYLGHWGAKKPGIFNGPTGPNQKDQWTKPITWSEEGWRGSSIKIPDTLHLGRDSTSFFCTGVAGASRVYTLFETRPEVLLLAIAGLIALGIWAVSRTLWLPSAPLRVARRRTWGQILSSSASMYGRRPRVFLIFTALLVPIPALITLSNVLINRVTVHETLFQAIGSVAYGLGVFLNLLAVLLVPVGVALAMARIDDDRPVTFGPVLRETLGRAWSVVKAGAIMLTVSLLLAVTVVGIPLAVWYLVRWTLQSQVIALEGGDARNALRRSARLAKGHWWKTATITFFGTLLPIVLGPFLGALLILATGVDFDVVNLTASLVAVFLVPFGAVMKNYLYHDLRVRAARLQHEEERPGVLPAEIDNTGALA